MSPRPSPGDLLGLYERERRDPTPRAALRDLFAEPWGTHPDYLGIILMASWARPDVTGWPLIDLPRKEWLAMFERVGYLHNGFRSEQMRPNKPLTLYRGATHAYRRGLSWTTHEPDARFYAERYRGEPGHVYAIDAEPSWLLARVSGNPLAPGGEYVVNAPKGSVRLLDPPAAAPSSPLRVMFVCRGNICRSPLAALILRRMADEAGVPVEIASSGVAARPGDPMDPGSLACAERHGLDGSGHAARRLALPADLARSDVFVVLDSGAGPAVNFAANFTRSQARVLVEPVVNPWRRDRSTHERAWSRIETICADVLDLARSRAVRPPDALNTPDDPRAHGDREWPQRAPSSLNPRRSHPHDLPEITA
ncbi:hypothetical protein F6B41_25490 [Microbacterium lushaniae]|nr:hypothetical protein F6B41_33850 [Microbacterium lushaniae]KAA9149508.1 hypothetical protein F6B41_25490 [Microbacterium lushaniae]